MDLDAVHHNLLQSSLAAKQKKTADIGQKKMDEAKLREACAGFESIFINTVIKSMRKSLPGDAVFPESNGMNIYKSMYDQYLADHLSKSGSPSGIGEYLYRQLKDSL